VSSNCCLKTFHITFISNEKLICIYMNIHEIIKTCGNIGKYKITLPLDTAWMSKRVSTYWKTFSDPYLNNQDFGFGRFIHKMLYNSVCIVTIHGWHKELLITEILNILTGIYYSGTEIYSKRYVCVSIGINSVLYDAYKYASFAYPWIFMRTWFIENRCKII